MFSNQKLTLCIISDLFILQQTGQSTVSTVHLIRLNCLIRLLITSQFSLFCMAVVYIKKNRLRKKNYLISKYFLNYVIKRTFKRYTAIENPQLYVHKKTKLWDENSHNKRLVSTTTFLPEAFEQYRGSGNCLQLKSLAFPDLQCWKHRLWS